MIQYIKSSIIYITLNENLHQQQITEKFGIFKQNIF